MVWRLIPPGTLLAAVACAAAMAAGPAPDAVHVLAVRSGWEYAPAAEPPALEQLPATWQQVTLPHRLGAEPCGFFRASFAVPAAWAGLRIALVARPLGGSAWVWLNGQLLGARAPAALDLRLDATRAARPGTRNTLLVAIASPGEAMRGGLGACWLEASSAVGVDRIAASASRLVQGAVVDVALDLANGSRERFEGRVELALEAQVEGAQPPRVWRRASDVRVDAGQAASVAQSFEPDPSRLWRPDDPFLYRLTATVQTREGQAVGQLTRRIGLRSVEVAGAHAGGPGGTGGRWLANGEWVRFGAVAFTVPGATLLCTQPGQAGALAERLAPFDFAQGRPGRAPSLDELLDFCDEAGIVAFLDVAAWPPETPGGREALDALAAEAALHPCVWGWVVGGELDAARAALARLRDASAPLAAGLAPRLPVGRAMPDLAADAQGFDFLLCRFTTRVGREDDDAYGRRLDDLIRDAAGKPLIVIDRINDPTAPGMEDRLKAELRTRAEASLAHRGREAERRPLIAALAFEPRAEPPPIASAGPEPLPAAGPPPLAVAGPTLLGVADSRLSPFRLHPPHHEVRAEGDRFVIKSRFEAHLASPVAQRLPCWSLVGYRLAWRAAVAQPPPRQGPGQASGEAQATSGLLPLSPSYPRAVEGGCGPGRAETEWRLARAPGAGDGACDLEFVAELQSAAGRVLARHRAKLSLRAKGGKAELSVQPLEQAAPAPPPPPAANVECVHLNALAGHFNNDGISWRANPADGNFDFPSRASGASFIADLLPKKGALLAVPGNEGVTFRFPDKDDRLRNNVLCDGQRLQLARPYGSFEAAWFLGACHDGARSALLTVDYEDGKAQGELRLADWLSRPAAGEIDVLRLSARHAGDGKEEARDCGLVAWRVPLDPSRKLMALTLPRERNMHVFAVTLTRTRNP